MKIAWGLAFCLLLLGLWLGAAEAAPIREGLNSFNGYVLEMPLSHHPSLKLLKRWSTEYVQEVGVYENPGERLTLDGIDLQKIQYRFTDGRLESVQLMYQGRANRDKLVKWIEERYGRLTPPERKTVRRLVWLGDQMAITLSFDPEHDQGKVWFFSPQLFRSINMTVNSMPD